jgi:nucleotidyltransferase/DNA polymerase involved in DNA repair
MTVACVAIPHFALRLAVFEQPALDGLPLALITPSAARPVLLDCTPEAAACGIKPTMLPREISALCPDAVFIQSNPVREAAAFETVVASLERFSPLIEIAELGRCYIDLSGLDRHDGSLEESLTRLLRFVPPVLRPRAGAGPGKFSAWVAARQAPPGASRIIPAANLVRLLAKVPASWLPCPPAMLHSLDLLGLHTLGHIAALPASAMQARFGQTGRRAWELARGIDDDRIQPIHREETIVESMPLPDAIASRDMLLFGLRELVARAFNRPDLKYRQVRQVRLRILIENNRSWEKEMTFREPLGRERLMETLRHRLQAMELPGPAERLVLELMGVIHEIARQELIPLLRSRNERPVIEAVQQLKQRYGSSPLFHIAEVEPWSRIPERRHALISYDP